ncbi:MAG: hypothetical protein GC204_21625 [Chloroflexi bacterium]|nr:hypothetical protein [Chloroflexota bacterium]
MRRLVLIFVVLIIAGCNLTTGDVPTPTSGQTYPTVSYTPPTPYRAPNLNATQGAFVAPTLVGGNVSGGAAFSAQSVGPTATPGNILTPVPAESLIQNPAPSLNSQNAIEAFVNNLVVPVWNFIYTFFLEGMSTLWLFAGARGGIFAQIFCCIAPAIALIVVVVFRVRIFRFWRR